MELNWTKLLIEDGDVCIVCGNDWIYSAHFFQPPYKMRCSLYKEEPEEASWSYAIQYWLCEHHHEDTWLAEILIMDELEHQLPSERGDL